MYGYFETIDTTTGTKAMDGITGTSLVNYGALGVMVLILVSLVYYLLKAHQTERAEWQKATEDRSKATADVVKENTEVIRGFTSVVSALETLIKDRK